MAAVTADQGMLLDDAAAALDMPHLHSRTRRAGRVSNIGTLGVVCTASALLAVVWHTIKHTMGMPTGWGKFGLHPLLMTLAFGFLAPVSVTSYRGLEDCFSLKHGKAKLVHAALMTAALACGIAGVVDMWIVHEAASPRNHLISIHSWLGLAALIAFGFQWLTGALAFYTPLLERLVTKRGWLPAHIFIGSFSVYGTLASIALGALSLMYPKAKEDFAKVGYDAYVTAAQLQMKGAALLVVALAGFVGLTLHGGRDRY